MGELAPSKLPYWVQGVGLMGQVNTRPLICCSPCGMTSGGQVDFKRRSRVLVPRWENREPLLSSSTRLRFSKEVHGFAKNLGVSQKHWWNFVKLCSCHDKNSALLSKAPPLNKNALEISLRHFYHSSTMPFFHKKRRKTVQIFEIEIKIKFFSTPSFHFILI